MSETITIHQAKEDIIRGVKCMKQNHYSISSRNCDCLLPYQKAFYQDGKKVIPIEFIKDKFTDISLAYWFMDDGGKDKSSNSYIINTQCFTRENLQEFIEFLREKFNLLFSIKKDRSLYLRHCSNNTFTELVSKYITQDMQYKLLSS